MHSKKFRSYGARNRDETLFYKHSAPTERLNFHLLSFE